MNRQEYLNSKSKRNSYYKQVQKLLQDWKLENNITERCDVHHRDDTEECIKYNNAHYELWGFNEDGTFEYGKYVLFITRAEHTRYHNKGKAVSEVTRIKMHLNHADFSGEKAPMYGKHHTNETKAKMSAAHAGKNNPMYGKNHSEETCEKISAACKGKKLSNEHRTKISATHKGISILYTAYKNNGGALKWREFRKALKNGEITFEMLPNTIYTNEVHNES